MPDAFSERWRPPRPPGAMTAPAALHKEAVKPAEQAPRLGKLTPRCALTRRRSLALPRIERIMAEGRTCGRPRGHHAKRVHRLRARRRAGFFSVGGGRSIVLTYHGSLDRAGRYVVPGLTYERARGLHLDGFDPLPPFTAGHAQPLFWRPPGSGAGVLIVATEEDEVYALDARSGAESGSGRLASPFRDPRSLAAIFRGSA